MLVQCWQDGYHHLQWSISALDIRFFCIPVDRFRWWDQEDQTMQHLAIPNDIVHHFLPHFRHILMRYFQPVRVRLELRLVAHYFDAGYVASQSVSESPWKQKLTSGTTFLPCSGRSYHHNPNYTFWLLYRSIEGGCTSHRRTCSNEPRNFIIISHGYHICTQWLPCELCWIGRRWIFPTMTVPMSTCSICYASSWICSFCRQCLGNITYKRYPFVIWMTFIFGILGTKTMADDDWW